MKKPYRALSCHGYKEYYKKYTKPINYFTLNLYYHFKT